MASWMARSQFSPTSLKTPRGYKQEVNSGRSLVALQQVKQAAESGTHMIGSNMFLIFRHGVRLLGGEFLRSRGKAEEERQNL